VRQTFLAAIEQLYHWRDGEPEPVVKFEVNYEPVEIPISRACTLVWNCTDVLLGLEVGIAREAGLKFKLTSYAGVARAMLRAIRKRKA
jgi:hypothetical protein